MSEVIEISYYNLHKHKEVVPGDTFLVNKTQDKRIAAVLADGMGSGVKANVLSQLTASMALKFTTDGVDPIHAAQTIMETLPICSVRNVSYSTLTSLDISPEGFVKILEYDNPELLWSRDDNFISRSSIKANIETMHTRDKIFYSEVQLKFGDRLIFFSDGVTQAGMGTKNYPFGWKLENVKKYIADILKKDSDISAKDLSMKIVEQAKAIDLHTPKDDITCAVAYYRKARRVLLLTGPPSSRDKCPYIVEQFKDFNGHKIVSGGTTSQIIADGIGEDLAIDMKDLNPDIPPRSIMKQADLVSEGLLTINKVIKILKEENVNNIKDKDAAYKMVQILIDSDLIHCLVGTAINEAHQSPDMPVEMGLRRTALNRLAKILKNKYLKEVTIEYV